MPRTGDLKDIARWAHFNANEDHRRLIRHVIRIHSGQVNMEAWRAVEKESDAVVEQVLQDLAAPCLFGSGEVSSEHGTLQGKARFVPSHFVTAVWGEEYAKTFVNITLPTILSLGNIPAVPNKSECLYKIYTTEEGRRIIEGSRAFAILNEYVRADIYLIQEEIANKYVTSSNCYRDAVREADRVEAATVFLIPDMILADGSIRSIVNILRSGKKEILITGIRLVKETVVPRLLEQHSAGGVLSIGPRDLIRLALDHVHPITRSHYYDGDSEGFHPAGLYWRVRDEGFLLRCFHLHPVAVFPDPQRAAFTGTIDDDMLDVPELYDKDIYIVSDSDEILWCEISSLYNWVPTPKRAGVEAIAQWMINNTNTFHRSLIHRPIRLHTGSFSGSAWKEVETKAGQAVADVLTAFETEVKRLQTQSAPPAQPVPSQEVPSFEAYSLGALVAIQIKLARAFIEHAKCYLRVKGPLVRRFPQSFLKLSAAGAVVGGFLVLRTCARAYYRIANRVQKCR
jgi:hypothetical protein